MTTDVYDFRAFVPVILVSILLSFLPAWSIFELMTTGSVDLRTPAPGRLALPRGIYLAIGWICFGHVVWHYIVPAVRYLRRGSIFVISGGLLKVDGAKFEREDIESYRFKYQGLLEWNILLKLETTKGELILHPGFHPEGVEAIRQFLGSEPEGQT